ncbi:MAG TPA: DUF4019 domain-containing protein [Thermoanaerobaculia bacterium]|jgi:hypothetical protein|nr:DUF4019 domain-containing protein [Thermoanaerobaculia bacterium]
MRRVVALSSLIVLLAFPIVRADEGQAVSKAQAAAKSWLALTDAGKFGASWDEAAALFQKAISKADWEKALGNVRGPLGAMKSRKLKSATFTRTLPNAPDGEYVVIQFDTQFEGRSVVETVTPMKEKDGSFKVSGYFVK